MKKKSLPVIGAGVGVLLTLGVGGALASGAIGGDVQPTSDDSVYVAPSETTAATTTDAPAQVAEVPAQVTQEPPVEQPPTATVDPVTTPAPEAPADEPEIVDPESIGSRGEDGNYTPAPPRQNPGEPPSLPDPGPVPVEPLPGEPGYNG